MATPLASLAHEVPVLGPIGIGLATLGTAWQQVLAADSSRRGIVFHNPGGNNLRVAPSNLAIQGNAGSILIYPGTELPIFAESDYENVGTAWMGWVDQGSNQPITILNFTGNNPAVANPPTALAILNYRVPITSPNAAPVSVGTASVAAIGANPVRRRIDFHNPGTVRIAVCPANLTAVIGAGSIVIDAGQTKSIRADFKGRVRVNCGWNVIAERGSGNPVTMLEYL